MVIISTDVFKDAFEENNANNHYIFRVLSSKVNKTVNQDLFKDNDKSLLTQIGIDQSGINFLP